MAATPEAGVGPGTDVEDDSDIVSCWEDRLETPDAHMQDLSLQSALEPTGEGTALEAQEDHAKGITGTLDVPEPASVSQFVPMRQPKGVRHRDNSMVLLAAPRWRLADGGRGERSGPVVTVCGNTVKAGTFQRQHLEATTRSERVKHGGFPRCMSPHGGWPDLIGPAQSPHWVVPMHPVGNAILANRFW